jgi:hypothetical protein
VESAGVPTPFILTPPVWPTLTPLPEISRVGRSLPPPIIKSASPNLTSSLPPLPSYISPLPFPWLPSKNSGSPGPSRPSRL